MLNGCCVVGFGGLSLVLEKAQVSISSLNHNCPLPLFHWLAERNPFVDARTIELLFPISIIFTAACPTKIFEVIVRLGSVNMVNASLAFRVGHPFLSHEHVDAMRSRISMFT